MRENITSAGGNFQHRSKLLRRPLQKTGLPSERGASRRSITFHLSELLNGRAQITVLSRFSARKYQIRREYQCRQADCIDISRVFVGTKVASFWLDLKSATKSYGNYQLSNVSNRDSGRGREVMPELRGGSFPLDAQARGATDYAGRHQGDGADG